MPVHGIGGCTPGKGITVKWDRVGLGLLAVRGNFCSNYAFYGIDKWKHQGGNADGNCTKWLSGHFASIGWCGMRYA